MVSKKKAKPVEYTEREFVVLGNECVHEIAFLERKQLKLERDLTKLTAFVFLVAVFTVLVCLRVLRVL